MWLILLVAHKELQYSLYSRHCCLVESTLYYNERRLKNNKSNDFSFARKRKMLNKNKKEL